MNNRYSKCVMLGLVSLLSGAWGCAVGQAPGKGRVLHLQEQSTKGWYYLYLPEDYVSKDSAATQSPDARSKRWPIVVTFHGMKPFDDSSKQIREWQQEADRYGFVVIAPQLRSPDLLSQFPLRTVHGGVRFDEKLTIGALNDVARRVDVDLSSVLSTSWSSGGYIAHYMVNRFPDHFSCVAPRQSNFSSSVLDPKQVPKYRDMKVGIFYTENDFEVCKRESQAGANWYAKHGFDVTFAVFQNLGHVRRPSVAADFFARTCNATAKTPPTELARLKIKNMPIQAGRQNATPKPRTVASQPLPKPTQSKPAANTKPTAKTPSAPKRTANASGPNVYNQREPDLSTAVSGKQGVPRPRNDFGNSYDPNNVARSPSDEPTRPAAQQLPSQPREARRQTKPRESAATNPQSNSPVQVRVSSTIGVSPLMVSFSAVAPGPLRRGAYFLWTDNGEPISNGINGQKYLLAPGKHELEVLMTTAGGTEYRAKKTINVLEKTRRGRRP
ncbi:MAG: hypothetical protein DHS20C16_20600 [Phycisphaerae bacterium]|nr:MAG: hypothetical protein DHS20C16_20600 [Phycisphaerae bacterium]